MCPDAVSLSCDVLVVGAGPAGSAAAQAAALGGADVLLVERRARVGAPVQCAEYIPKPLVGVVKLGKDYIAQPVQGMKTFITGGEPKVTMTPGFVIHRDRFDQAMADAARDAGARIMLRTSVTRRHRDGTVGLRRSDGRELRVLPRIILGADGPRSTVGKWMGAVNTNLLPGVQFTLPLHEPCEFTEIYFEPFIHAGYGWLFPKGGVANVGLGLKRVPGTPGGEREALHELLWRFVRPFVEKGRVGGTPLSRAAGWIPAEKVRRSVYGNVALVGDAAGHTHPITGAGIFAAVTCGEMAGRWGARAALEANPMLLSLYESEWRELFEDPLDRAMQRRRYMEAHWEDFEHIIPNCWVAYREYYRGAHAAP